MNSYSTYINYRLDNNQYTKIRDYLKNNNNNNFEMLDTAIIKRENKEYFLSINIYINATTTIVDGVITKS